jgi:hypothetical protein
MKLPIGKDSAKISRRIAEKLSKRQNLPTLYDRWKWCGAIARKRS